MVSHCADRDATYHSWFHFSHRPVDIHNVYNGVQVKLLMRPTELTVPDYDDVFRDDDVS